jgi:hypothetical protein
MLNNERLGFFGQCSGRRLWACLDGHCPDQTLGYFRDRGGMHHGHTPGVPFLSPGDCLCTEFVEEQSDGDVRRVVWPRVEGAASYVKTLLMLSLRRRLGEALRLHGLNRFSCDWNLECGKLTARWSDNVEILLPC